MWQRLSEYHTGYRAFSREVLETLPLLSNSDDFVFDNEMLAQVMAHGYRIGEVSCPTKYFKEASSINFLRSVVYGFGVIGTSIRYRLWRWGLARPTIFDISPTRTLKPYYEAIEAGSPAVSTDTRRNVTERADEMTVA